MGAMDGIIFKAQRWRYRRGNSAEKKRMLDDFAKYMGIYRKAVARLQFPIF